ncbi:hypothetical protein LX87_00541 [Larkinella arboricola]|uniref:6-bladed beta-propeller protein n=1 Tax=Larkinella arboricola TaxID=643671 RepID=A0A327X6R2_LARAB|nr:hypothetical protein [Larkinella arboricola]RAK02421.1 hypothetical protein LX87_00541 [Larkinella arboricola]
MKISFYQLALLLGVVALLTSCQKEGDDPSPSQPAAEYQHVRLLVAHGTSNQLTQITPANGTVTAFEAQYPNAALYTTASGRFAALLYGSQNFVQYFDSGLEYHGDHVDVKGTPKFAAITSDRPKPTHFKTRGTESLVFNDGDGTLSIGNEADFHMAGAKMKVINAGLTAHHGAMAKFDNGTYAVTFVDAASKLSGPHGVKIIDATGKEVSASKLPVSRLHGNATDGTNAVFGVAGGALVVTQSGGQRLIPNPEGFGDIRLGTVLEAAAVKKFIGFVATKGAYFIDIVGNKITPIYEGTDIMQCKVDRAGKNLLLLLTNGTLKIYDLSTGSLKKEGSVIGAPPSADTFKPVLEATEKYAYIALPALGEVHQINLADFAQIKKHKVSAQPTRLVILGHETDDSH